MTLNRLKTGMNILKESFRIQSETNEESPKLTTTQRN